MALFGALRRLASSVGPCQEACVAASPLSRGVHTLKGFSTAKFANAANVEDEQPVLSGVVPITGPLSAAWYATPLLLERSLHGDLCLGSMLHAAVTIHALRWLFCVDYLIFIFDAGVRRHLLHRSLLPLVVTQ